MQNSQKISKAINAHIGKRLLILRSLNGMTQKQLGEIIGISYQQIQKYEIGLNKVSAERLFELSSIFNVPLSYFFIDLDKTLSKKLLR